MGRTYRSLRHAKIVCTIGPATSSPRMIEKLIYAGMDVARLNFSHGDYKTYERLIETIRAKSQKLKKPIAIVQDLQGPKIRTGKIKNGKIILKKGQRLTLTTKEVLGDQKRISVPYKPLSRSLKRGNPILIDDGLIELVVLKTRGSEIECRVITDGILREHKGVNVPYLKMRGESLTLKDKRDLAFGIRHSVDFVAISFVCRADDIREVRRRIPKAKHIGIIAKIEKRDAIDRFDEILQVSDAIMVARGDLAVESSSEIVPCLQKEIIQKCNQAMKPVITATQMLESMARNPRPTRAEASDVANAIVDGTDAVMLSSETAFGKYPVKSVMMMDRIIREMEQHDYQTERKRVYAPHLKQNPKQKKNEHTQQARMRGDIERAVCQIANGIRAKLICCLTETGRSAIYLSASRSQQPILALTEKHSTLKRLYLYWGVHCYYIRNLLSEKKIFKAIRRRLLELRVVKRGDRIVISTGVFTGSPDTTRIAKVHQI